MTIIDNHQFEVAHKHLNGLLMEFKKTPSDIIITDRYHFTHAFRTEKNLDSIHELEQTLFKGFQCTYFSVNNTRK